MNSVSLALVSRRSCSCGSHCRWQTTRGGSNSVAAILPQRRPQEEKRKKNSRVKRREETRGWGLGVGGGVQVSGILVPHVELPPPPSVCLCGSSREEVRIDKPGRFVKYVRRTEEFSVVVGTCSPWCECRPVEKRKDSVDDLFGGNNAETSFKATTNC